jgi:toxin ParE1/3/4
LKLVILHSEAKAEAKEAISFLNNQRDGFGDEFRDELEKAIERIRRSPKAYSPYRAGYRKYLMEKKRFPYQIFYFEYPTHLWIAAIYHAKREPDKWMNRSPNDP